MIITQPIITESRWPTMEFVGEWRGAGALQGLPRWMTIVNEDGTPTGPFLLCARSGVEGLVDGTPTQALLDAWIIWTS